MEPEVGRGVRELDVHLVELPFVCPLDNPLVEHRVGKRESLQNPRSILPDAIPPRDQAVFYKLQVISDAPFDLLLLLDVVFLPFQFRQTGVPSVELGFLAGVVFQGVKGVQDWPVNRVSGILQGVADYAVYQGVYNGDIVFVPEWIYVFKGIRREDGVPRGDQGSGVGQLEECRGVVLVDDFPATPLDEYVLVLDSVRLLRPLSGYETETGISF